MWYKVTNAIVNITKRSIYATSLEHISKFYDIGDSILVIDGLLNNEPVPNTANVLWKINNFTIKEELNLLDPDTVRKLNLPITSHFIHKLCSNGDIILLEKWKNSGLILEYDELSIDSASGNGHINVLEWWINSGLLLKYSYRAIHWASENKQFDILEWWKEKFLRGQFQLKYLSSLIDWLSTLGIIEALEWWKNSKLEFKYTSDAVDFASMYGQIKSLEWWKDSKY